MSERSEDVGECVSECHDTGVCGKPLEVRSWVREYLKQAVRRVFEDENEDSSTQCPVSKNGKMVKNVMKKIETKDERSEIRCYL